MLLIYLLGYPSRLGIDELGLEEEVGVYHWAGDILDIPTSSMK
jgi:hypothetical protein